MDGFAGRADRFFRVSERGSTFATEIKGGLITFLSMAYVLAVNPAILHEAAAEYPFSQLFTATALAAMIACVLMGLYSRFPVALAPGMGVNAFLAYTVCLGMGFTFEQGLAIVFVSGALFFAITVSGLRNRMMCGIPESMKLSITAGIGLFIAIIGLYNSGVIVHGSGTALSLGDLTDPGVLLSVLCVVITLVMWLKGRWFAVIGGILATWAVGLGLGACGIESALIPSWESGTAVTCPDFGLLGKVFEGFSFIEGAMLVPFLTAIVSLTVVDLFDTTGTLIGVGSAAGLTDSEGRIAGGERAMTVDAASSMIGAVCGTSTTTSYVESVTGIGSGARTGILPLTAGALFAASLLFSGIFSTFTGACTVGAMVLVGILMMRNVKSIDWDDPIVCVMAFMTIVGIGMTASIANGIAVGTFVYVGGLCIAGRRREVSGVIWALTAVSALFVLTNYVVIPLWTS